MTVSLGQGRERRERTPTKQGSAGSHTSPTVAGAEAAADRQFVVIASEKQARVVALPSQNCVYRQQIVDTDFVVKSEIVSLKGMFNSTFESNFVRNECKKLTK